MVRTRYIWDDDSYAKVAAAGLTWTQVLDVLDGAPLVRERIGAAVLRIAGWDAGGVGILVTTLEQPDGGYLVVAARELDSDETALLTKTIGGAQ